MRDNVIGPRKPKEFNKNSWECKVKKMAEEAQGKQTGPGHPKENKWTQESASDVIKEPMTILGH